MKSVTETKAMTILEPTTFDLSILAAGTSELSDNLDQIEIRLPQISILHQAQMFQMPDETKVASFEAVILDFNRLNAYWKESFDKSGGQVPPDCFSLDAVRPSPYSPDLQADYCQECKQNAFGSDGARGKKCQNKKRVHVLIEPKQMLPYRLTLPPSNLKAFDLYVSALVGRGFPWRMVSTLFKLKPAQNKGGIVYSEIVLSAIGQMPPEQVALSKKIADKLMPILRDKDIRAEEYDGEAKEVINFSRDSEEIVK